MLNLLKNFQVSLFSATEHTLKELVMDKVFDISELIIKLLTKLILAKLDQIFKGYLRSSTTESCTRENTCARIILIHSRYALF